MRKNLFKRMAAFMAVAVLAAGTMAGCGKSGNGEAEFDSSKNITVVSREDGSGTRGAFIELTGVEQKDADGNKVDMTTEDAIIQSSTQNVLTSVSGDTYAIGYISLGSLNDTVKAVKVDGTEATTDNVKSGAYAVQRPFNIVTKTDEVSDAAADFISYIMSAEGQKIIEDNGYIAVNENAESYKASGAKGEVKVSGSSSVTPVMEKLKEAFEAVNSDITVTINQSDSSTGVQDAIDGKSDVGMASRDLKDSEVEGGAVNTVIAKDGIAIIVNKDSTVDNLTSEQIMKIYTGEYKTWADVK